MRILDIRVESWVLGLCRILSPLMVLDLPRVKSPPRVLDPHNLVGHHRILCSHSALGSVFSVCLLFQCFFKYAVEIVHLKNL